MLKYWHELTADEQKATLGEGKTWGELQEKYVQPDWCNYPKALQGKFGCWSLLDGLVSGKGYCKGCDCYIAPPKAVAKRQ